MVADVKLSYETVIYLSVVVKSTRVGVEGGFKGNVRIVPPVVLGSETSLYSIAFKASIVTITVFANGRDIGDALKVVIGIEQNKLALVV